MHLPPPLRRLPGSGHTLVLTLAIAMAHLVAGAGEPYVPESDDRILVRLSNNAGTSATAARSRGNATPVSVSLADALAQARALASAARRDGDPRRLGRAQRLLAPWWNAPEPTAELCLEKARIRQGLHQFEAAQNDVRHALRLDPRSADAWLLAASMALVCGDYPYIRHACLALTRLADPLVPLTLSAAVRSLEDPHSDAERPLAAELRRRGDAPPALRAWSWTTLGDIQARGTHPAEAEQSYRNALALEPGSLDPLACLADVLLDAHRPDEVVALLRDQPHPALRLRLAEAASRKNPADADARRWVTELGEAFALDQLRGDNLHQREHARYLLHLRHDAAGAFALARRNWAVQKEPPDARILMEAATASGRLAEVAAELDWIRSHQPGALGGVASTGFGMAAREPFTRP